MGYKIFISYSMKDTSLFQLPQLTNRIKSFPKVDEVFYCEADVHQDIVDYMDKYLRIADVIILLCTPNSEQSQFVQLEYKNAIAMNKRVIPVFLQIENIPTLVRSSLGVQWNNHDFNKNIDGIQAVLHKMVAENYDREEIHQINKKNDDISTEQFHDFNENNTGVLYNGVMINAIEFEALKSIVGNITLKNGSFAISSLVKFMDQKSGMEIEDTHIVGLGLSNKGLENLPDTLKELSYLQTLNLCCNRFSCVPDCVGSLSNLKKLSLGINSIKNISKNLGNLKSLTHLDLIGHNLKSLPDCISTLNSLTYLNLRRGSLKSLPDWISSLRALQYLNLSFNPIKDLPQSLGSLSNLETMIVSTDQESLLNSKGFRNVTEKLRQNGCAIKIIRNTITESAGDYD
jgi:Leucine-rich repeat (LRR) protein